jgi:RimJ/RimL family protein N-acetyltransferase
MARPVAQIARIKVRDFRGALTAFDQFVQWKDDQGIDFCTAKIPHGNTLESFLVQARGYHFIELNYRPEVRLDQRSFDRHGNLEFKEAVGTDLAELCDMASRIYRHTRFNLDPFLDDSMANIRYANWMKNAFEHPGQRVVKCMNEGRISAFFVQEYPKPKDVFWSLVGMAPEFLGQGLAKQIWSAALNWLSEQGVSTVSTSISSLNTAVVNLYARLGFAFPAPDMTFHWHRHIPES